jgi:hypothetical protein
MSHVLNTNFIENNLRLDGQQPCGKLEWLEESHRHTQGFWRALKSTHDAFFDISGVSVLFNKYNFYHDIITRNRNNPSPALCLYDLTADFREISYSQLGTMASAKAGMWARLGLHPEESLCIIRPMGLDLAIDLLAALKTGLKVSFLPPQGKAFLERRLEALKPDHIVIDEPYLSLLTAWKDKVLTEAQAVEDAQLGIERFYVYPSGQAVFSCFDPCSPKPWLPMDITSDAAYLCGLSDGIIGLGLSPGHVYAAPGFHLLETQPALLLAGLLCGATYLHLLPEDIAADPGLVIRRSIKAFGVSKRVRDILLSSQVDVDNAWECWFRDPAESSDMEQWQLFVRDLKLENAYAFNLKCDAALGGCSFFSVRRKGMAHMNVLPAPGRAWSLADPSGGDSEAPGDRGVICLSVPGAPDEEKRLTTSLLAGSSGEWIFTGTSMCSREGRSYPADEIHEILRNVLVRSNLFCSITDVPLSDTGRGSRIVLLVFKGSRADLDETVLTSKIRKTITEEMGHEFQPDRIVFFPIYPRFLSDTEVDHDWCHSQYLSGALSRKSRGDIFQCMTRLRECVLLARPKGANLNKERR